MLLSESTQGVGFVPKNGYVTLINRTGARLLRGSVVQLDFTQSDTDTTNTTLGSTNAIWTNAILPTGTLQTAKVYAITLETSEDNAYVKCQVYGTVLARVTATATIVGGAGMLMPAAGSGVLVADSNATQPADGALGFNIDALTSSTDQLKMISFDGQSKALPQSTAFAQAQTKQWLHDMGATTISAIGTPVTWNAETTGGAPTLSAVVSGGVGYEQHQTNTSSGDSSGRITSAAVILGTTNPTLTIRVQAGANVQNIGYWFGLTSTSLLAVDNPTTELIAAFRYDTAATPADPSGFWSTVTSDGANSTITNTAVAIAISTAYELKIEWNNSTSTIRFYVNGTLAATHTTNLPAASTGLHIEAAVITKTNALKRMALGSAKVTHG